jgi:streptogramin lyase
MKRRTSQLIGLLAVSLLFAACNAPAPNPTPTSTPISIKPLPTPFQSAAWQVWPAVFSPQSVFDVARGEQFMWIGTSFGVVRLDPATRTYTSYDQLGHTLRVFPMADDAVYAGTTQGVYYFDGQGWSHVTFTSTYPILSDPVTAFGLDTQGDLWMLGYASRASLLYHLTGHVPPADPWAPSLPDSRVTPAPPTFPFEEPACDQWPTLATYTYGYRTPDECRHYHHAYTLLERRGGYGPYAAEADDSFWWVSGDQLLHLSAADSVLSTHSLTNPGRLATDPQHGVWIAANDEGLLYATDAGVQQVSIGLEKYTLFPPLNLAIDTQGTVWVATERGLQQLSADEQHWQLKNNNLGNNQSSSLPLRDLIAASESGVWLSDVQQLVHYDGHNLVTAPPPPEDQQPCLLSELKSDRAGHVWAGSSCGILEFDPATKRWQRHLVGERAWQFSLGMDGSVVVLNRNSELIARPAGTTDWKLIARLVDAFDPRVVADNHGDAWVGLPEKGEVWHYQAGSAQPTVVRVPTKDYFTLLIDRQSRLWLSTTAGLLRHDGRTWQTIESPPLGRINTLKTAPDGRLWFAGERGVAVYDPRRDAMP